MAKLELKLHILQLTSNNDKSQNLQQIIKLLQQVQSQNNDDPQLIVLPENSIFMKLEPNEPTAAISIDSKELKTLQSQLPSDNVEMLLTTAIKSSEKVYNSTVQVNNREIKEVYRKIHLFDVDVEGENSLRESDQYSAGESPTTIDVFSWKLGLSICYDLRFAELYSHYAKAEVDLILVPSAFLKTTGAAHWQPLLRARAIESQCFMAAPAQAGQHLSVSSKQSRETYGHSMIIDPWGRVIAEARSLQPEVLSFSLNPSLLEQVRRQIPMKFHRKQL